MSRTSRCAAPGWSGKALVLPAVLAAALTATGVARQSGDGVVPSRVVGAEVPLGQRVNETLGLLRSDLCVLDVDLEPGQALLATVPIVGELLTLDLAPHSVRAPGYRVRHALANGSLVDVDPGPVNTLRGTVLEAPGSRVAASILDDGLHATVIFGGNDRFWVQPVSRQLPDAPRGLYAVYHDEDVIPSGGVCGMNDKIVADRSAPPGGAELGGGCEDLAVAELACDADFQYFQDWGAGTAGRINSVINSVNNQYEDEVGITHEITEIIIRTSPVYSSNDAFTLLSQFRDRWLQFHGSVPRDVAHLFTGRELNGGTIGIAWGIGEICTSGAYCLSQSDCCGAFACATDLTAHELGHLWGAFHCDPCSATMRSFIGCFNHFVAGSQASIQGHRDTRTCLEGGPANYCSVFSVDGSPDYILNVNVGTIDHSSGGASDGYTPWICFTTELEKGALTPISVTVGSATPDDVGGLWIDWNQDLDFDDPGETITTAWSGPGPYTTLITVPGAALPGETRLRVRVQDGLTAPNPSACGPVTHGEAEDYTVIVVDDVPGPINDDCSEATPIGAGAHPFATHGASTDGPAEPLSCNNGDPQYHSDVWFRYDATCTGIVNLDLCDADFDTKVVVYADCPVVQLPVLGCGDNECGLQSTALFVALAGESYSIRIGAGGPEQGTGTLVVSDSCLGACCYADGTCTPAIEDDCTSGGGTYQGDGSGCLPNDCPQPVECPGDIDGPSGEPDGVVGFPDLLAVLSQWGPCAGCPADIDGPSGEPDDVVGFPDLLLVLSAWGPCP